MAEKFGSFGAIFEIGDGDDPATAVFTPVASLEDIGGPSESLEPIDVTTHDSPKAFREFVAGVADAGEITFSLVWDESESTHDETTGVIAMLENRTMRAYRITTTGTSKKTIAFKGLVTAFEPDFPVSGAQRAEVTIKISSHPIWADVP